MATRLFKDGKAQMFPARRVQAMLQNGWSVTEEEQKVEATSTNDEEQALRQAAKDAGIRNWHNMGVDKLKERLEEEQQSE